MDGTLTMPRPTNPVFSAQTQPYDANISASTMDIADVDMSDVSMNEESLHPDTSGAYSAKSSQRTSETSVGTQSLEMESLNEKSGELMPAVDLLAEAVRQRAPETAVVPQQGQKRFANGHVKSQSMMSYSTATEVDRQTNARVKNSPSLYEGKTTKEMANSFQLRVQYLMKKRELGWEDKSFQEVEQLVQQGLHNSPRRKTSPDRTASRGSIPSSTTSNRLQNVQQADPARYSSYRQKAPSNTSLQPPVQLDDAMQISPDLRQQSTSQFDPRRQPSTYPRTPTLRQHESQSSITGPTLADGATAQEKDAAEMLIFMRSPGTFSQPVRQEPPSPQRPGPAEYSSSQPNPVQHQHQHQHDRQFGHVRTASMRAQVAERERGRPITSPRHVEERHPRSPLTPGRAQAHTRGVHTTQPHMSTSMSPRKPILPFGAQLDSSAQIDATLDRMASAELARGIKAGAESDSSSFSEDEDDDRLLRSRDLQGTGAATRRVEFGPRLKRESGGSSGSDD